MESEVFHVLDSRAGMLAMKNDSVSLELLDDDWERFIMESGTAEGCCEHCNAGTYGTLCVFADEKGFVQWKWFYDDGTWKPIDQK